MDSLEQNYEYNYYCTHFKIVIIISSSVMTNLWKIPSLSSVLLVVPFLQIIKRREHLLAAASDTKAERTVLSSSPKKKATLLCISSKHVNKLGKRVSWLPLKCSSVPLFVIFLDLLKPNSSYSYLRGRLLEKGKHEKDTVTTLTKKFSYILRQCVGSQFTSSDALELKRKKGWRPEAGIKRALKKKNPPSSCFNCRTPCFLANAQTPKPIRLYSIITLKYILYSVYL